MALVLCPICQDRPKGCDRCHPRTQAQADQRLIDLYMLRHEGEYVYSLEQIARLMGWSGHKYVNVKLYRLRKRGVDIPYRHRQDHG
jgi:biotin operon repressor